MVLLAIGLMGLVYIVLFNLVDAWDPHLDRVTMVMQLTVHLLGHLLLLIGLLSLVAEMARNAVSWRRGVIAGFLMLVGVLLSAQHWATSIAVAGTAIGAGLALFGKRTLFSDASTGHTSGPVEESDGA